MNGKRQIEIYEIEAPENWKKLSLEVTFKQNYIEIENMFGENNDY